MLTETRTANHPEFLITKLAPPRLGSPRVLRRSLLDRLEAGLHHKLTLLSAPAGYGKTTLVSEWVYERMKDEGGRMKTKRNPIHPSSPILDPFKFAWVSLDNGDNDPVRFWRYVFEAIRAFDEEAGSMVLELLHASQNPDDESVLTGLINALVQRSGKHLLILDDVHSITNPKIHAGIAFLLEHLPPALHLVLATRSDPELPLARLRARNEINELRAADLRFSPEETQAFLEQALPTEVLCSNSISSHISARLAERTEGWPAGLRLVALALQGRQAGCLERFLDTFSGGHRTVLEYLAAEVLATQSEDIQEFILETSFLSRLTSSLCEAVTGRNDSAALLDQLERANLFLEPLDGAGQWYRFHALFAEAMRCAAGQRLGETRLQELPYQASLWYEENAMPSEAVEAALFAETYERAASLIERAIKPRLVENEYHTLLRWIENLPEEVLAAYPALCMTYAQAVVFTSEMGAPVPVDRLQAPLELAERSWAAEGNEPKLGELFALRALIAAKQGNLACTFDFARQALERLPESRHPKNGFQESGIEWRGVSLIFAGWEEFYRGRLNAARRSLTEGRALCQVAGNIYGVLDSTYGLGEIHARQAEPRQAGEFYRQVLAEIEHAPIERKDKLVRRGRALLGLAALALEWDDLEAAEQQAAQAAAAGQEAGSEDLLVKGSVILARVERARGEVETARERLAALSAQIHRPLLLSEVELWQARLGLAAGDLTAAQRWPAAREGSEGGPLVLLKEQEALTLARLQIAQGDAEAALLQLGGWLEEARSQGRISSELEIRMLVARAQAAHDRLPQARQALLQALALAQPAGYRRLFLDEGEPMRLLIYDCRLMIDLPDRAQLQNYIDQLLYAFPGQEHSLSDRGKINTQKSSINNLIEPLTSQEERVLRLLGAGLSKPEIAEELVISVNTVKSHVKSIYGKLHINDRKAAREAARQLRLRS